MIAIPFKRDLRYLQAAAVGGWLPLPRLGSSKPSESLYSILSNLQSFVWILDRVGRGWCHLAGGRQIQVPGVGIGRWMAAGRGDPLPSPLRPIRMGDSPKFSLLFLGWFYDC